MAKSEEETPNENNINLLNEESEVNAMTETKLERLTNTSKAYFLNITPEKTTKKWAMIGTGITQKENSYGAKTNAEHWISEKNERHSLDGYSLGSDVEQTAYKGDGVFDFVDELMYRMKTGEECETEKLEIYKYRIEESGAKPVYKARLFTVLIIPNSDGIEGGNANKIKYKLQAQGDPTFGTVTFSDKGEPVFTEEQKAD